MDTVECKWGCGQDIADAEELHSVDECHRCWDLRNRIQMSPRVARKMLDDFEKETKELLQEDVEDQSFDGKCPTCGQESHY